MMLEPPMPPDEQERVARLHRLGLLDTAAEERFDRITRIVSLVLDVPMVALSLIDSDRQWFKSKVGIVVPETSRRVSFCGHTILTDQPLIVPDALKDPRFADSPLVLAEPHIRSYAGYPLADDDGHRLAVLCVMDDKPRAFTTDELATLRELATVAGQELRSIGLDAALRQHRESLERVDAITESLVDGLIAVDRTGTIVDFNAAAERIFGYRASEVVGAPVGVLIPEPYGPLHGRYFTFYTTGPTARNGFDREAVGLRKDGTLFPVELAVTASTAGGEPLHLAIVRDITERRSAENAVRRREEEYWALADLAPIGIFRTDADGVCTYVNRRWCEISGLSSEDAAHGDGAGTLHADDAERVLEGWAAAVRDGEVYDAEYRFQPPGGKVTLVRTQAVPQYASDGQIEGYLGVLQDITEQRAAEVALRSSEEVHRAVVDSMNEGILIQHRDGRIVGHNMAAQRIFGLTADQLLTWAAIERRWRLVRDDGTPFPAADNPALVTLRTGAACSDVIMGMCRPDGEQRWISIQTQPLVFGDGTDNDPQPWGVSCIIADITERRAVDQMKSEFVALVSHELRTPLTSIRGALGLLAGGALGALNPAPQRMLDIAVTNTDRLIRLVNDILDIERMESGSVGLARRTADAAHLISQAVDVMQPMADKAGITLKVSVRRARIWVDPDRIIQTLTNLLSNAIKFSPAGTTVWVRTVERNGMLQFEVVDQGRGVPPEKIDAIFGRFQQVDTSNSRDRGGSGLGLAICRTIIDQHGGRIWARSTLGEGSVFAFSLPLVSEEDTAPRQDGPTVLLVDNDQEMCGAIVAALAALGCGTAMPSSAKMVTRLARTRPDAILLDLDRPGLAGQEGWRALAEHRANPAVRDVPVIVAGGTFGYLAEAVQRALDAGREVTRALLIQGDPVVSELLEHTLAERGIAASRAQTVAGAMERLERLDPDLVLLDLRSSDQTWLPFIDAITDRGRCLAIAVVSRDGPGGADLPAGPAPGGATAGRDACLRSEQEILAGRIVDLITTFAHRRVRELACVQNGS